MKGGDCVGGEVEASVVSLGAASRWRALWLVDALKVVGMLCQAYPALPLRVLDRQRALVRVRPRRDRLCAAALLRESRSNAGQHRIQL